MERPNFKQFIVPALGSVAVLALACDRQAAANVEPTKQPVVTKKLKQIEVPHSPEVELTGHQETLEGGLQRDSFVKLEEDKPCEGEEGYRNYLNNNELFSGYLQRSGVIQTAVLEYKTLREVYPGQKEIQTTYRTADNKLGTTNIKLVDGPTNLDEQKFSKDELVVRVTNTKKDGKKEVLTVICTCGNPEHKIHEAIPTASPAPTDTPRPPATATATATRVTEDVPPEEEQPEDIPTVQPTIPPQTAIPTIAVRTPGPTESPQPSESTPTTQPTIVPQTVVPTLPPATPGPDQTPQPDSTKIPDDNTPVPPTPPAQPTIAPQTSPLATQPAATPRLAETPQAGATKIPDTAPASTPNSNTGTTTQPTVGPSRSSLTLGYDWQAYGLSFKGW